jgi:hypothetical protein
MLLNLCDGHAGINPSCLMKLIGTIDVFYICVFIVLLVVFARARIARRLF